MSPGGALFVPSPPKTGTKLRHPRPPNCWTTQDGTAETVSRDQILRRERGQGNVYFPCSTDHEQDRQPYPVDPYSVIIFDEHSR